MHSLNLRSDSRLFVAAVAWTLLLPSSSVLLGIKFNLGLLLAALLVAICISEYRSRSRLLEMDNSVYAVVKLQLLLSCFIGLSYLINLHPYASTPRDVLEIMRPIAMVIFLLFGAHFGHSTSSRQIIKLALGILIFEFAVCLFSEAFAPQSINLLSFFWKYEKFRTWRAIGTMANPNRLGFFTVVLCSLVLSFKHATKEEKCFAVFLTIATLIFASSRSSIAAFTVIACFLAVKVRKPTLRVYIGLITWLTGGLLVAFAFKEQILSRSRYLRSLYDFFESGLSTNVILRLFKGRISIAEHGLNKMVDSDVLNWMIGAGPRKIDLALLDNDFVHHLVKYGVLGLLLQHIVLGYFVCAIMRKNQFKFFLSAYVLLLMIFSIVGEAFASWVLMPPFFLFLGAHLNSRGKSMELS